MNLCNYKLWSNTKSSLSSSGDNSAHSLSLMASEETAELALGFDAATGLNCDCFMSSRVSDALINESSSENGEEADVEIITTGVVDELGWHAVELVTVAVVTGGKSAELVAFALFASSMAPVGVAGVVVVDAGTLAPSSRLMVEASQMSRPSVRLPLQRL